jgi:hypothetical protein
MLTTPEFVTNNAAVLHDLRLGAHPNQNQFSCSKVKSSLVESHYQSLKNHDLKNHDLNQIMKWICPSLP